MSEESNSDGPSLATSSLGYLRERARRFLLATIIVTGIACGASAVAFHDLVRICTHLLIESATQIDGPFRIPIVVGTPVLVAALLALIINRFAPGTGGANLARVRLAYHRDPSLLNWRTVVATFFLTPLSLGSGVPLGPESPTVVVSSGISVALAKFLHLPKRIVRGMIPVGTAAGIAAIFNTPIAAVVFALEEILGTAQRGVLGSAIVASVAAAVVQKMLLGGEPLLGVATASWTDERELIGFALVGIIAGLVSGCSIHVMKRGRSLLSRAVPNWPVRAAVAGALIGITGLAVPSIFGVGYDSMNLWLSGGGTLESTGIAFAAKTLAFIVAVSGGLIGGTFAPSLFAGTALGAAVGHAATLVIPEAGIHPGAYALVGMGAFFAGLLRNPIASVLIVIELTRDYDLILPLMLAVALSIAISRKIARHNLVDHQMGEEGFTAEESDPDPAARIPVSLVMTRPARVMQRDVSILQGVRSVAGTRHRVYPVVDERGRLEGIVKRDRLDEAAREDILERPVIDVTEPAPYAPRESDPLGVAVRGLARHQLTRCPVVSADGDLRVVGFLS
ncbi:MAG: chloride channel protein, partial [Thermoanaerobaculia bacterium]|nr:chloride channel protein [Thermoanaerobaculia bacterium]